MKYSEQRELIAQMQLLNDRLDQQDQKHAEEIRELKLQFAGVDEEEEKLKADCLEADLKAFHSRPKWERVQHYKNDDEYTQEWLEHWEEDPRLLKYRQNRDEESATEPKPKSKPQPKPKPKSKPKPIRTKSLHKMVKEYAQQGYSLKDIEELTGIDSSTVSEWIIKFEWERGLPRGKTWAVSRLGTNNGVIPSLEVTSGSSVVWDSFVTKENLIAWFKENNVIDEESEMWQKDVASEFAAYVGFDNIHYDMESHEQVSRCGSLSRRYYQKLGKVITPLIKEGVLHKEIGVRKTWQAYEDVKDEEGEPVLDDSGFVVQELLPRATRMNILYLNMENA